MKIIVNLIAICFSPFFLCLGQSPINPPNVILIMADDQGYGDVSFNGNPILKTPYLDSLAMESVRFTDFHVAPMCTPTRGQLITGLDAMRNGATAVCQGRSMILPDIKIMPEYFKEKGYATGMFGKWHLGDSYPYRPRFRGFDEVLSFRAWGITSLADYWGNDYFDPVLMKNGIDTKYRGYCTDIFFQEAMKFMANSIKSNKPFFVYIPTNTPHVPEIVSEYYSHPYDSEYQNKKLPKEFYGMISNIDENLGALNQFLEINNLKDNTILIYLSDNGTQNVIAKGIFNAQMRDHKTSVYEGGHRVPLFIRWKDGQLKHNIDITALTQVQDLLPTLIDFCQLEKAERQLDGLSLSPLLKGHNNKIPSRICVSQYRVSGEKWDNAVVMMDKWRLVKNSELYNVQEDPSQKDNLYTKYPNIAKQMTDYYDDWHYAVQKEYVKIRPIIVGSANINTLTLYASDWQGGYCDNRQGLIRADTNGYWDLDIATSGKYEIELRRWPEESNKPIVESFNGIDKKGAINAVEAKITIADYNETKAVGPNDKVIKFLVMLDAGKTTLQSFYIDPNDKEICGAMYVKISKISI